MKVVVIEFTKVDLPYGWLGNMYASPIRFEGKIWRTSEALFQALRYDKEEIRELIRNEMSPMAAKMKAKKFKDEMVVEPMSEKDVENMKLVVRLKFDQNPALKSRLKISGEHKIVENIGDRNGARHLFWGMKKVNGEWVGENMMGKILMELREEYKKEEV